MTFASPLAFWFLAIAIPIAALFFFRVRPTEIIVPTLALWERFVRSSELHGFGVRFGRWPTLLIQLLIVALLVLALSDPGKTRARASVIVLDDSATMQTREPNGRTRFDEARSAAIEQIHAAPHGVEAIILAGEPVRILTGRADSPAAQESLVAALAPRDVNADLPRAIRLASVRAQESRATEIVAITDKPALAAPSDPQTTWQTIGHPQPNLAIAGLRRSDDGRAITITLHQQGFTNEPAVATISADGREIDREELRLNGPTIEFDLRPPQAGDARFEVRVEPTDALPLDNVAFGVWTNIPTAHVLLVTTGNLPLLAALSQPNIEVKTIRPTQWPSSQPADVIVLDAINADLPDLENGRFLVFGGRDPLNLAINSAPATDQRPVKWTPSHPLLRDVDLLTWRVRRTATFGPSPKARPIVSSQDAALILESELNGSPEAPIREILVNFELKDSNLPTRAGFPIFIWNAVQRLLNRSDEQFALSYTTGSPVRAPIQSQTELRAFDPTGAACDVISEHHAAVLLKPQRAGFYRIDHDGQSRDIAINWLPNSAGVLSDQNTTSAPVAPASVAALGAPLSLWSRILIAVAALMLVEMALFSLNILRLG